MENPIVKTRCVCETCGTVFYLPPWRMKSPNAGRFCRLECRKGANWNGIGGKGKIWEVSDEVIALYQNGTPLRKIGEKFGFTASGLSSHLKARGIQARKPTGANLRNPEVMKRIVRKTGAEHHAFRDLPMEEMISAYTAGASTLEIAAQYDVKPITICRRLRNAGVELRPAGYSELRVCEDGCLVKSNWEWLVHDWLIRHRLPHETQPRCPWPWQGKSHSSADFKVGDTYIEVWGVYNDKKYEERRVRKIAMYREVGARLIQVFPHHLTDRDFTPLEVLLG